MTFTKIKRHLKDHRASYYRGVPLVALAFVVLALALALQGPHPFTSAEVAFTDAVSSGLAIVPASCPSSPDTGSCGCGPRPVPTLQCVTKTPAGFCTRREYVYVCPGNYIFDGNWCVVTGSTCGTTPTTCPVGYTFDATGNGGIPVQGGGSCVFTGCPSSGYTQTTDSNGNPECVLTTPTSCVPGLLCNPNDGLGTGHGNLYHQYADCSISKTPATPLCKYGCTGRTCNSAPPPEVVTFSLAPSLVQSGKTTIITWDVKNVTDCSVTGSNTPPDSWTQPSGTTSWTSSGVSSPVVGQTIYTLHCTVLKGIQFGPGEPPKWVDQTLSVNIVPTFHEQ